MDIEEYTEIAIRHAATCLLWQATDASEDGGNGYPIGDGDEYRDDVQSVIDDVPYLSEAVTSFVADYYGVLFRAHVTPEQCGHDFILTANHHGAGFWDRGLGVAGDVLTEAAHGYSIDAEFVLDEDGAVAYLCADNVVLVNELGEEYDS